MNDEELIKIAQSEPAHIKNNNLKVINYIKKFNITYGETFVPCSIIYHHYRCNTKTNYLTKITFFKSFSKEFESKVKSQHAGYMLDPAPYDITQEGYLKARAFLRKERDEKKKKKQRRREKRKKS